MCPGPLPDGPGPNDFWVDLAHATRIVNEATNEANEIAQDLENEVPIWLIALKSLGRIGDYVEDHAAIERYRRR